MCTHVCVCVFIYMYICVRALCDSVCGVCDCVCVWFDYQAVCESGNLSNPIVVRRLPKVYKREKKKGGESERVLGGERYLPLFLLRFPELQSARQERTIEAGS